MAGLETSSDESDAELVAVTPANKSSAKRASSAAAKSSGSSSSSGKNTRKTPKRKTRISEDDFETAMVSFLKDVSSRNRAQVTVASKTVALAEDFKRMADALGSRIKAAYACDAFVQFLDKSERKELKYYAADQESSDNSVAWDK